MRRSRCSRIAVIIPVLDEEGAIGPVLAAMPRGWVDQVIVVDGGSRDRTVAEARAAGATVLVERERGYGRACAKGAAAAIEDGAEILVFLDGDGGDRPEAIPSLVQPILEDEQDFVIGSRTRGCARKAAWEPIRRSPAARLALRSASFMACVSPTCAPSGRSAPMRCGGSACAR